MSCGNKIVSKNCVHLCRHWLNAPNGRLVELRISYSQMQVQLSDAYVRGQQLKAPLCHFQQMFCAMNLFHS